VRTHRLTRALFVLAACAVASAALAAAARAQNYIVLYKQNSVASDVATKVETAGGSLVYSYPQIGVAIASSNNLSFRDNMLKDSRIENVSGTGAFATKIDDNADGSLNSAEANGPPSGGLPNSPATDADTFSAFQWDMKQIQAPEAHAITGGSPSILVGDIDTGVDFNHPDLRQNLDVAASANCVSGAPVPGTAAQDDNGHGTHTAGTIAAASNGIGIVGVAPNVRLAAIKAGNAAGFFFPEAVVCAFMQAATQHMNVTNNSYFADPFEYNCKNDPTQRAIWKAESRAILYAEQQGVSVVAAEGNDSDDTAHPTQDITSPDDTTPVARTIHNDCVIIPVEVPGVIGVSATGTTRLKSFYSNYGVGVTQVAAPGGDSLIQPNTATDPVGRGRVLSTWPPYIGCPRQRTDAGDVNEPISFYCYAQGTSMASPHVAGIDALLQSWFGPMAPNRVKALIDQTAAPTPCPDDATLALYAPFPGFNSGLPQTCQGGTGYNSWYGNGIANALKAVTHTSGNG
jgi:lantibiotic leader peptide-processing serine protease